MGWNLPIAKEYGINSIPCLIFVGADGNVITSLRRCFPTSTNTSLDVTIRSDVNRVEGRTYFHAVLSLRVRYCDGRQ
ncbi:hypothetical protein [Blastopirellula retiformator]|uniref:hypothetical protein n=1 Tax=Blastopirellula retiformator TaxID=2527970 RepID=UPI0011B845C6|nr:hypothetical protein [Blastopirellula retiformator]